MLILGIDPGYTNLGLAVIDSTTKEILWSETVTAGVAARPDLFGERLWPKLESIGRAFELDGVATETPPYLTPGRGKGRSKAILVKTSALLARVSGIIQAWAASRDLDYMEIAPLTLKRYCKRLIDCDEKAPSKKQIREALVGIYGSHTRTNHTDDAALIATLYAEKTNHAA